MRSLFFVLQLVLRSANRRVNTTFREFRRYEQFLIKTFCKQWVFFPTKFLQTPTLHLSSDLIDLRCVQSMGQISWSTKAATAVQLLCSSALVEHISAMLATMTSKGSPAFQSQIFLTARLVRVYWGWIGKDREG